MKKTESHDSGDAVYRSISCDVYSELELAIMHRQRLRLVWREANVCHTQTIQPLDLETRAHQEFLHCRLESGEVTQIRLDHISHMESA